MVDMFEEVQSIKFVPIYPSNSERVFLGVMIDLLLQVEALQVVFVVESFEATPRRAHPYHLDSSVLRCIHGNGSDAGHTFYTQILFIYQKHVIDFGSDP